MKRRGSVCPNPAMESTKDLVAITTAAAVFTTTAAAAGALFARLGDIDREGAAIQLLAVQGVNGLLSFLGGAHGDESEAAGAAGHAIHHQVGFGDRAMRREGVLQVVLGDLRGNNTKKQVITHVIIYYPEN